MILNPSFLFSSGLFFELDLFKTCVICMIPPSLQNRLMERKTVAYDHASILINKGNCGFCSPVTVLR